MIYSDFKLTVNFAKKLSIQGKTERAEQAMDYFIKVEDRLKEVVMNNSNICKNQKQHYINKAKRYTSKLQYQQQKYWINWLMKPAMQLK